MAAGAQPSTLDERATELVAVVRGLDARGWLPATSSNFSVRAGDRLAVSESGVDKAHLGPHHLLAADLRGQPLMPDGRRPSAETLLHCAIYRQFPEVQCVLHTHSVNATVLSLEHEPARVLNIGGLEILKGFSGITTHESTVAVPVFANSQDMEALAAEVGAVLGQRAPSRAPGFLLAGHGLYAWGRDVTEAKRHVEVFEFVFECIFRRALLRAAQPLAGARALEA